MTHPRFHLAAASLLAFGMTGHVYPSDSETTVLLQASNETVLAVFEGGEVQVGDIEREIRFLPKDERRYRAAQGTPVAQQWRDWAHREALRQIVRGRMASETWDDDPWLQEKARQAARDWGLKIWRQRCYGLSFEAPDETALRAQLPGEAKMSPARLRLSHIFLRAEGPEAVDAAHRRLEALRDEATDLKTFQRLAREHSQSQSSRKDGKLGYLRQGWLPKALEEVLYALPEGTMSPPVEARGGVHLFFVEKNEPARPMPRDQELRQLRAKARHGALELCRRQRLEQAQPPKVTASPVVGPWSLSQTLVQRIYGTNDATPLNDATQRLVEREALFQWALANSQFEADERQRLDDLELNQFLGALVQIERTPFVVEPTENEVRALYDGRPNAFKTPLRLSLQVVRAQVPESADPIEFLRQLETLASSLANGAQSWQDLAAHPPQHLRIERWDDLPAMEASGRTSPFLMSQLAPLPAGHTTDVIQDGADFYIVHLAQRHEPTRKPFGDVEAQLRRGLMKERNRQASGKAVQQLLDRAQFRWTAEGLSHLEAWKQDASGADG